MANSIFLGVTTAPARDFVARAILTRPWKRIYFPCAGRFGLPIAYRGAGGDLRLCEASDIGLFSTVLGYLADPSLDLATLELRFDPRLPNPGPYAPLDVVAQAMLCLKYGQISPRSQYGLNHRADLRARWLEYREQIRGKVERLVDQLAGMQYRIRDLWEVVEEAANDPDTCLAVNVPTYKGGYRRMFAASGVTWTEPQVEEFDPNTYHLLLDRLTGAACTAIVYCQRSTDLVPEEGWRVLFGQSYTPERSDYVLSNQTSLPATAHGVPANRRSPIRRFPIYREHEIAAETQVSFVRVDRETCHYYRDLFVHKLGTTNAESYFLLLLDGRVVTAMGLNTQFLRRFQSDYVYEVFGISKTSARYKRLGKLFMLLLTSGDMRRFLEASFNFGVQRPRGIQTTSITTHPEGKTDRSVMRLVHREELPDGRYRIIYRTDFRDDTWPQVLVHWLETWGDARRREATPADSEGR